VAEVAGFWSYTHADDESDRKRIRGLAEDLKSEYGMLTGDELTLFVDKADIRWGDEWRKRIEHALGGTTFLIPIATPRYFQSEECRKEVLTFMAEAKSAGVPELLLPVLYVDVPELTVDGEASTDEVIRMVAAREWADWREVRLADRESEKYRTGVSNLARQLVEIANELAERPSVVATVGDTHTAVAEEAEGDEEDAPGLMDRIALAERVVPEWVQTTNDLTSEMQGVEALTTDWGEKMNSIDPGKGAVARLRMIGQFAADLTEPANRVRELGRKYASQLVDIDSAVQDFIRFAEADSNAIGDEDKEFFATIENLIGVSEENADALKELIGILDNAAGLARDLRKPIGMMKAGLAAMLDALGVMQRWRQGIDALGLDLSEARRKLEEATDLA
jgi:hypothetical protein